MPEKFTNFGLTTLAGNIDSSVTTIPVASGANLPLLDFYVTIDSEVIYVAVRSGTSLTGCLRGQKTSSGGGGAASHSAGAAVYHGALAHHLDELYAMSDSNVVAVARRTTSQSLASGAATTLSWESVTVDTDGIWSSTAPTRLTARRAGKYVITGTVRIASNTTGTQRAGYIMKNGSGSTVYGTDVKPPGGAPGQSVVATTVLDLAVGDYVEFAIYSDATAAVGIDLNTQPTFSMAMISGGAQPNTPSARVRRNTAQSFTSSSSSASFSDARWDTDLMWDSAQPTRLTCKTAGKYVFSASVHFNSSSTDGWREAFFRLNGDDNQIIGVQRTRVDTSVYQHINPNAIWDMKVGDYVELRVSSSPTLSSVASTVGVPFGLEMTATMIPGGLARSSPAPAGVQARMVKTSGGQAIPALTWTGVTWQSTSWDTGGLADPAGNRFVIRQDGKYRVSARMLFTTSATNYRRILSLWVNGLNVAGSYEIARYDQQMVNNTDTSNAFVSGVADLKAGDVVTVGAYASVALTHGSNNPYETAFEIELLSGNAEGKPPAARVQRVGAAQTINHATDNAVVFTTAIEDTDLMWSSALPSRLTVKTAGKYVISGTLSYSSNTTGVRQATILVNGLVGGRQIATQIQNALVSAFSTEVNVTGIAELKVGDYIELWAYQNSGTTLSIGQNAERSPVLSATLVSAATRGSQSPPNNVSARIRRTTTQSIPQTTGTKVSFAFADHDTDGMWNSAAPDRLTVRTPGRYLVTGGARWAVSAGGTERAVSVLHVRGGTTSLVGSSNIHPGSGGGRASEATAVVDCQPGDYLQLEVYQDSGAALNLDPTFAPMHLEAALLSGTVDPVAPGARLRRSTTQSISSGAWTDLVMDTRVHDSDGMFDSTNGRLVCRTAGQYTITAHVAWAQNASGERLEAIAVNGNRKAFNGPGSAASVNSRNSTVSTVVDLKVGDIVTAQVYSTVATSVALAEAGHEYTALAAVMAAPAGMVTSTTAQIPRGVLGYAPKTSSQSGITSVADLTGLSSTVSVDAGRRVRITVEGLCYSSVADDVVALEIKEGATVLQIRQFVLRPAGAGGDLTVHAEVILNPSAGNHTYKATLRRASGTGSITFDAGATYPAFLIVEDIGSA